MSEEMRRWLESTLEESGNSLDSPDVSPCCCDDIVDQLFEYVDRQLSEVQESRLNAHVSGCLECAERTEAESHVREILRRCCQEQAPSTLRARIVSQIEVYRRTTS